MIQSRINLVGTEKYKISSSMDWTFMFLIQLLNISFPNSLFNFFRTKSQRSFKFISMGLIWLRSCDKSESHNLSSQSPTSLFWNTKQFYFHRWAFDALRTLLTYCPHFFNTFRFFYLLSNRLHSRPLRCRCLIYLNVAF